jgi:hypothetical protein
MIDLDAAEAFMESHARLVERLVFAYRFREASAEPVLHVLQGYQNEDGGFGHALEADLRGPESQPIHVDMALRILDEVHLAPPGIIARACSYLQSVSSPEGGVPAIVGSVMRHARAEHWNLNDWPASSLNPTAMIAGLLHSLGIGHPWLDAADQFVWDKLSQSTPEGGGPTLAAVFCFLNHTRDRRRAVQFVEQVASAIPRAANFSLEPPRPDSDYVLTPLHLAPTPASLAGGLFAPELLQAHLDALEARQQRDGGWPITWRPPGPAAREEWRGRETLEALITLDAYGRMRWT